MHYTTTRALLLTLSLSGLLSIGCARRPQATAGEEAVVSEPSTATEAPAEEIATEDFESGEIEETPSPPADADDSVDDSEGN